MTVSKCCAETRAHFLFRYRLGQEFLQGLYVEVAKNGLANLFFNITYTSPLHCRCVKHLRYRELADRVTKWCPPQCITFTPVGPAIGHIFGSQYLPGTPKVNSSTVHLGWVPIGMQATGRNPAVDW